MITEARTPEGAPRDLQLSRDGALLAQMAQGQYADLARKGKLFVASTAAAGVAPGTVLSTQPPFILYNPSGSGKVLSILKARMGYISGTLGAGTIQWAALPPGQQTTAPTGGTALDSVNLSSFVATASVGRARQTPTALVAAPGLLMPAFILSAFLASTAGPPTPPVDDFVDGAILVQPGGLVALQGVAAAGSSPLVQLSVIWAEIDP